MKKSKVIVPALALIAFSTAASITGTVAWFSSSRKATFSAGTYQVVSQTNNLKYAITAGLGTAATAGDNNTVSVKTGYTLTDASFDHVNKLIFEPNEDATALKSNSGVALASATESNMARGAEGDHVLSVFTWDITFTMSFGSVGHNMGLYIDCAALKSAFAPVSDFQAKTGFRMAFVGNTETYSVTKVFADLQSSTNAKYISNSHVQIDTEGAGAAGSFAKNGDSYVAPALIDSSYNTAVPADDYDASGSGITSAAAALRADYIGTFPFEADADKTLSYTVVCWYEGTDPNVQNGKTLGSLEATLYFEAATFKAAA